MKQQMTALSRRRPGPEGCAASADVAAADAEVHEAGFKTVMDHRSAAELAAASEAASDAKFGQLYGRHGRLSAPTLDKDLAAAVTDINDKIAKQAALQDTRFSKTVKDLAAAKAGGRRLRSGTARADFATGLAAVTAQHQGHGILASPVTSRVIAAEVISHKAAQAHSQRAHHCRDQPHRGAS